MSRWTVGAHLLLIGPASTAETVLPQACSHRSEGNSDSHVKTALVGNSVTVLIDGGHLLLGRSQGVYFCEFDGPRERRLHAKLVNFRPPTSE
jgi:secondary thiamine-phosphate synthase enzyme